MLRWLVKFGSYTVFLRVIAMVSTLGFVSVTSFWMPKADYGLLAVILSVAVLAGTIGGYGLGDLVVRDISPLLAEGRDGEAQAVTVRAANLAAWVSVIPATATAVYFWLETGDWIVVASSFSIVVLLGTATPLAGAARSHNRYLLSLGPKDIFWRLSILGVSGALVLAGISQTIDLVAPIAAVALLVVVGLQARALRIPLRALVVPPDLAADRGMITAGFALMLSAVCITAQNTVDVILVGAFMSAEAAAEYFPANRIALAAGFFTLPFQMLVAPRIAVLMAENREEGVRRLVTLTSIMLTVLGAVTAAVLIVAYPLYAPGFATRSPDTFIALAILVMGPVLNSLLGLPGPVLVTAKRQKEMAWANVVTTSAGIAAMAWATTTGNLAMMAVAVNLSIILRKFVLAAMAVHYVGIWPFSLRSLRPKRRAQ